MVAGLLLIAVVLVGMVALLVVMLRASNEAERRGVRSRESPTLRWIAYLITKGAGDERRRGQ